jgi:type I restriction enzyme, S subunit
MKYWAIKKLGEVYDVRDGTHDSPKYINEGYALITSKNLKNDSLNYDNVNYISEHDYFNINKRSKVDVGDVLFAMIGTIGNPIVIKDEPDFAIKNVALFKVPENQDSYFLKYYLDSSFNVV